MPPSWRCVLQNYGPNTNLIRIRTKISDLEVPSSEVHNSSLVAFFVLLQLLVTKHYSILVAKKS